MSELTKFKYLHDGGPMQEEFIIQQGVFKFDDGKERRAVLVHVSDLTDHFRLISSIPYDFKKNEIKPQKALKATKKCDECGMSHSKDTVCV